MRWRFWFVELPLALLEIAAKLAGIIIFFWLAAKL